MSEVVNKLRSGSDSQDITRSGGWVQLPRRMRLGVIWAGVTGFVGTAALVITFAMTVQAKAEAAATAAATAQKTADASPARTEIEPRLRQLEHDRDEARAERKHVSEEISAVRLYLCRECERRHRHGKTCDRICRRRQ